MLTEVKEFYETLCAHRDLRDTDLTVLLQGIPTLSGEESELIEGKITYAEALAALSKIKNNKSPGPDGFSVEFYKFFLVDIVTAFVRSINHGFCNGGLSVTQRQGIITCIPKAEKPKQCIRLVS